MIMKQGWEIKTIGSMCDIKTGKLDANAASDNGLYPFFTCSQTPLRIDNYAYDCECVLVAGNGELNAKYYKGKFNAYQRTYIITTKETSKDVSVKYLYKFFSKYVEQLRKLSIGGVIKYIKLGNLTDATIPVPPIEEQERIVAELDCLSGVIEKKREQLRELDALAQSIFYQMFGDPITNEKGWEVKKLSDAVSDDCPISYGIVQPMEDVEGGIPIVRPIDLVDTFVRKDNLKRTSVDISNAYKRTILRGDEILMCVRGTTGVVSMASDELKGCNTTRGIVPLFFDSVNRWFVYYLIKQPSMQCLIAENTYGIALKQINIKELRLLPIITPPLSFQQEFAYRTTQAYCTSKKRHIIMQKWNIWNLCA